MNEEIKKIFEKFVELFGGIKQAVCLLVALMLMWFFTGISIMYSMPLIIFFWLVSEFAGTPKARKTLASILKMIVLVVFFSSAAIAYFPRVKEKKAIIIARIDQMMSRVMGQKVDVLAEDSWEREKERKSKEFLAYYQKLLKDGKTKEAADTLAGFKRHWDLKLQSQNIPPAQMPAPPSTPPAAAPVVTPPTATTGQDSIFRKGTYYIDVKGETSFNFVIVPDKVGCARYSLTSTENSFVIRFSDGQNVPATASGLPYRDRPKFKLFSEKGETVKLEVS